MTTLNIKRIALRIALGAVLILAGTQSCSHGAAPTKGKTGSGAESTVYFTSDISPQGLVRIYEALGVPAKGRVGIKISTGESSGSHHLSPELIKDLVDAVGGTLIECNTAYGGNRATTEKHIEAIRERGYDKIAKVDIMDADGSIDLPVTDDKWIKFDRVGSHISDYDFVINLAHFKGHAMGGFGGVLKNQSIGFASSEGKVYIHTAGKRTSGSIMGNLNQDSFLESMASAAQAVHNYFKQDGRDIIYINVMNNMSVDCDCDGSPDEPRLADIGILASTDPVALDQACLDLVFNHDDTKADDAKPLQQRINRQHGTYITEYAESIGLGSRKYKVENIDAFVTLTDAIPDAILEIRYFGTYNFVGERIDGYLSPTALLTTEAAKALRSASDELVSKGYRLKIYDAYRPQKAVDHFVRWAADKRSTSMKPYFYPDLDKSVLFEREYIMARSGHSRGSTVDLTIFDMATGKEVDMGGSFDWFGPESHPDFCGNPETGVYTGDNSASPSGRSITAEQFANRMILRNAMLSHGFRPLATEWWHFTLAEEPYPNTYFSFPVK